MKKTLGKFLTVCCMLLAGIFCLTACGDKDGITVVSREDGSGTRGAFIELTGVEVKNDDGTKTDKTTKDAVVVNSTQLVITNVKENKNAIGYISLGSLNDTVKAVKIGGVEASVENVKSGGYKLARPFNIAYKAETLADNDLAADFVNFIESTDGQSIIETNGYISVDATETFVSSNPRTQKITVSGSSSVSPVMEKLIEAYKAEVPGKTIELQTSDSTTGMNDAKDGKSQIGMASRALKDSEKAVLNEKQIATDGIAVIVNKQNKVSDLTIEQIKSIYTGETAQWSKVS